MNQRHLPAKTVSGERKPDFLDRWFGLLAAIACLALIAFAYVMGQIRPPVTSADKPQTEDVRKEWVS